MPRTARSVEAGWIYHVLNRGNGRMALFHKPQDFAAFEKVLAEGLQRYPVELLTYCLMSNHWHLVLQPKTDDALGKFMSWVGVTHVRRHHQHYGTRGGGHLYQGRYKSFPVQEDRHFLTLCRYVEANPLRAGMVKRAENWRWSGLGIRGNSHSLLRLGAWPVDRPLHWMTLVNEMLPERELQKLQASVTRGRPYGQDDWIAQAAARLRLEFTMRDAGRPRKNTGEGAGVDLNQ